MYQQFFQFRRLPFQLTPDPHFFFFTARHEEAFNQAFFGVKERKGFMVLTGEVGTGKTTLSRLLIEHVGQHTRSALLFNPNLTTVELLQSINHDFGIADQSYSKKVLTDTLNQFLLEQLLHGGNALLIIDEAQTLPIECLEEIRLLSNLETPRAKLLQILLIGQPELGDKLALPQLRQLNQRITIRANLTPLEPQEVVDYIQFRLWRAGGREAVHFEPAALDLVVRYSGGIPRLVNAICDRALLAAYVRGTRLINGHLMYQAIGELKPMLPETESPPAYLTEEVRDQPTRAKLDPTTRLALAGLVSLLIGLSIVWWKAESFSQLFPSVLFAKERLEFNVLTKPRELLDDLESRWAALTELLPSLDRPASDGDTSAGKSVVHEPTPSGTVVKDSPGHAADQPPQRLPLSPLFSSVMTEAFDSRNETTPSSRRRLDDVDDAQAPRGAPVVAPKGQPRVPAVIQHPAPEESPLPAVEPATFDLWPMELRNDHTAWPFDAERPIDWDDGISVENTAGEPEPDSVSTASRWFLDDELVLRVESESMAEWAALLMLLRQWGALTDLTDQVTVDHSSAIAERYRLKFVELFLSIDELLKLDYPSVVMRKQPGAEGGGHAVVLSRVAGDDVIVLDPLAGWISRPLSSIGGELSGPVWVLWRPLNGWRWPGPIDGVDPVIGWLQRHLRDAHLYQGSIDGLLGPETEEALQRLATQRGLAPLTAQSPLLEMMISQFLAPSGFPRLHQDVAG